MEDKCHCVNVNYLLKATSRVAILVEGRRPEADSHRVRKDHHHTAGHRRLARDPHFEGKRSGILVEAAGMEKRQNVPHCIWLQHFLSSYGCNAPVGERPFSPKNCLKTAILGEQIRHRLTSEGAGTQIFKGIANFSMCFEKFGTLSSKWAMGKASNFNSVRETNLYFFGGGDHEKLQKTDFFRKTLTPRNLLKEKFFQHRTMLKLTSRRIWKCIIYEGYGDFCASYYPSKSAHGGKSESVPIIMRC